MKGLVHIVHFFEQSSPERAKQGKRTQPQAVYDLRFKLFISNKYKKTPKWNLFILVRMKGLEPSRLAARAPKARVYTNFTTSACSEAIITDEVFLSSKIR